MGDRTSTCACDRKTVNILQACALAGVCRRTIYNWMADGKVEYVRTAGGAVRIVEDSLFRPGPPPRLSDTREADVPLPLGS